MGAHELRRSVRALIAAALLAAATVRADAPTSDREAAPPADAGRTAEKDPGTSVPSGPPPDVPAEVPVAKKEINYSLVPIPEIILDPNEGNTYGLMGVALFKNDQDEIQYLVAPDFRYNETKGAFPTFRLFA